MSKNYSDNFKHSIQKYSVIISRWSRCSTLSKKLIVGQSDEIFGVNTINWCDFAWKHLSLIGGEGHIYLWLVAKKSSLSRAQRFAYFQILCYVLEKWTRTSQSNTVWEEKLTWFKSSSQYRTLDTIDGEPMEFEWNNFPGFTTLLLHYKVQEFVSKMSIQPEDFTGRVIFMSMFNGISWWISRKKGRMRIKRSTRFDLYKKIFTKEDGHSSDLDQKRSGILLLNVNHKENGTELQSKWCWHSAKANTQSSEPRVHCHEERSKPKDMENYLFTSVPMEIWLKLFFAQLFLLISSVSTEQAQMCARNTVPVKQVRRDP